jgi:hypothetical protein
MDLRADNDIRVHQPRVRVHPSYLATVATTTATTGTTTTGTTTITIRTTTKLAFDRLMVVACAAAYGADWA